MVGSWRSQQGLLAMVVHPLTQSGAVGLWTDRGEGPTRMPKSLPQMLQPLLKTIHGKNVNDSNEVALLRAINDMQRVL